MNSSTFSEVAEIARRGDWPAEDPDQGNADDEEGTCMGADIYGWVETRRPGSE